MNNDKLIGLIARTLYGQNAIYDAQTGDGIPWDELLGYQECWQRDAEGLLTGLRTAGYTIVELPAPDEGRDDWLDATVRAGLSKGCPRSVNVELDPGEVFVLSVEYARDLAAALLAAADYAEKESKETQ